MYVLDIFTRPRASCLYWKSSLALPDLFCPFTQPSPLGTDLSGRLYEHLLTLWLPAGFGQLEGPALDGGGGGVKSGVDTFIPLLPLVMLPWASSRPSLNVLSFQDNLPH